MNSYELVIMYSPDLKKADLDAIFKGLSDKVTELGGKIKVIDDWGLKNLAYKVGKFEQAYYHINKLDIDSLKVNSVVTYLNHTEGVVRNLLSLVEAEE
ncbi:MAG: small subunit ribosomal protein [Patescibacteria group bacterium]|nr:small subunit ribosomal protein [Patescibacteria group bacterium]